MKIYDSRKGQQLLEIGFALIFLTVDRYVPRAPKKCCSYGRKLG